MKFVECEDERGAYLRVIVNNGEFKVDLADRQIVESYPNWSIRTPRRASGRSNSYVTYWKGPVKDLHRLLLNAPKRMQVDHEDGDGTNNRRYNIRLASHHQNIMNKRNLTVAKSGYRGVYPRRGCAGWQVVVWLYHKPIYLGWRDDPADAARLRDAWAKEHYGEFAVLNFPDE